MDFTYLEKKAITRLLSLLATIDGKIDDVELNFIREELNIDDNMFYASVREMDNEKALDTLNLMTSDKKTKFALLAFDLSCVDGFLHPQEQQLISEYFNYLGISLREIISLDLIERNSKIS